MMNRERKNYNGINKFGNWTVITIFQHNNVEPRGYVRQANTIDRPGIFPMNGADMYTDIFINRVDAVEFLNKMIAPLDATI